MDDFKLWNDEITQWLNENYDPLLPDAFLDDERLNLMAIEAANETSMVADEIDSYWQQASQIHQMTLKVQIDQAGSREDMVDLLEEAIMHIRGGALQGHDFHGNAGFMFASTYAPTHATFFGESEVLWFEYALDNPSARNNQASSRSG